MLRVQTHLFQYLLQSFGLQLPWGFCIAWGRRVGHDWVTELNWTEYMIYTYVIVLSCWRLNFKCILNTLHLYSPHSYCVWYFISNCFVYLFTAYCGYRWFLLLLSFHLPTSSVCGWFPTFNVHLPLLVSFFFLLFS